MKKKNGFTLIEVLIVMAVIGILAAIVFPTTRKIFGGGPSLIREAHAMGENYAESTSGVAKTSVVVPTGQDSLTVEQRNVRERLIMDNKIGSIKHLYVISAYSGQVIIYSTVKGKVTSSGKRLTPAAANSQYSNFRIPMASGNYVYTDEILGDDGTYGSSVEYIYWWDTRGIYHQHYVQGGQIVHVSDQPVAVKNVIINMEAVYKPEVAA